MDCNYCNQPNMEWRTDEVTNKGKIWDTNKEMWHDCKKNPFDKKQKMDEWFKKWKDRYRYKVPIWCTFCNKSYPYTDVCDHIRSDGFREGKDTCEFYADSYGAHNLRQAMRAKKMIAEDLDDSNQQDIL